MYLNDPYLTDWFDSKKGEILPFEISQEFNTYINKIEWNRTGTGINWNRYEHLIIDLSKINDDDLIKLVRESALIGNDPYIVFWYSPAEPCFSTLLDFGIVNVDAVYWKAPGKRYMFGAERINGSWHPNFDHFLEYDGADKLIARK